MATVHCHHMTKAGRGPANIALVQIMFTGNDDNTTNILSRGIGPGEQRAGANETHVKNVATNPRVNDPKMDLKRMHINDDDMETNLDDIAPTAWSQDILGEEFPP